MASGDVLPSGVFPANPANPVHRQAFTWLFRRARAVDSIRNAAQGAAVLTVRGEVGVLNVPDAPLQGEAYLVPPGDPITRVVACRM